jgi:putative tryptophan/tyrosine transport system substrate-binding protein
MNRREMLTLLGGGAIWPLAAHAQQKAMAVVGFLHSASPGQVVDLVAAFRSGLKESGFSEGQNVAIEYRWAENDSERLPALAADLVSRKVDLIAAGGGDRSARAAKQATSKMPIVAVIGGDPVAQGLVAGLSHPGGNLTGVSFLTNSLTTKRLELLLELTPKTRVVAFLSNSINPQSSEVVDDLQKVAIAMGLELHVVTAGTDAEVEGAFAMMDRLRVGAVVIQADPYFNNVRGQLISLAARYSLPAIQERGAFVAEGGLISYGTSLTDVYRQVGIYCGKILKGANPSDLPVLQPTKFELAVNLKTATALGLTIPPSILARADEVIE